MKFDDTEIEEYKFHQHKSPISINKDINKIIVSNKLPFGKQDFIYFIGYKDVRPLCIFCAKMSIYKLSFYKTRCMHFLIKDENFLEKCNAIWGKVSSIIKKHLIVNLYIIKNI